MGFVCPERKKIILKNVIKRIIVKPQTHLHCEILFWRRINGRQRRNATFLLGRIEDEYNHHFDKTNKKPTPPERRSILVLVPPSGFGPKTY